MTTTTTTKILRDLSQIVDDSREFGATIEEFRIYGIEETKMFSEKGESFMDFAKRVDQYINA